MKSQNEQAYEHDMHAACEAYSEYCLSVDAVEEGIKWGKNYGPIYAHLPELMAKACDAGFAFKVADLRRRNAFERLTAEQKERAMYGVTE